MRVRVAKWCTRSVLCWTPRSGTHTSMKCPAPSHHILTNTPHHTTTHTLTLTHNHKDWRRPEWSVVWWSWMSGVSDESDGGATSRRSVLLCVVLSYAKLWFTMLCYTFMPWPPLLFHSFLSSQNVYCIPSSLLATTLHNVWSYLLLRDMIKQWWNEGNRDRIQKRICQ